MRLVLALAIALPLLVPAAVRAAPAEARYLALRKDLTELEKDGRRGRFRDAWLAIERRLSRFAHDRGDRSHGCDARFLAARAHAGMAAASYLTSDRREAAEMYRAMARACQDSRLADDALLQARRLAATLPPPRARVASRRAPAPRDPPEKADPAPVARAAVAPDLDVQRLAHPADGELPLSVVAGLKVRRVVIDPGHGGHDAGTTGPGGTREKDVTLAIALKLAAELRAAGLEAVLTRDDDTYPELSERTRLANEKRADLFVSIHCNAARNHELRGVETFTLNLNSSRYAARLAARENAGSRKGIGELQMILADLATKANTDDSVRLARLVQEEVVAGMRKSHGSAEVRDRGVKQALFHVLLGARMPAILVEANFISHPEEEKRLRSEVEQQRIAASIRAAVERFIAERERLARGEDASVRGSGVF